MFNGMFLVLIALFVKHWYIDFVNQTDEEVKGKGIYGNAHGIMHSLKHGVATGIIFALFVFNFEIAVVFGFVDFVLHYHIDFCKMRFGNRDITTKAFWMQLGLDQLAHAVTYIGLVWILFV
jgi:hypothetical protein